LPRGKFGDLAGPARGVTETFVHCHGFSLPDHLFDRLCSSTRVINNVPSSRVVTYKYVRRGVLFSDRTKDLHHVRRYCRSCSCLEGNGEDPGAKRRLGRWSEFRGTPCPTASQS